MYHTFLQSYNPFGHNKYRVTQRERYRCGREGSRRFSVDVRNVPKPNRPPVCGLYALLPCDLLVDGPSESLSECVCAGWSVDEGSESSARGSAFSVSCFRSFASCSWRNHKRRIAKETTQTIRNPSAKWYLSKGHFEIQNLHKNKIRLCVFKKKLFERQKNFKNTLRCVISLAIYPSFYIKINSKWKRYKVTQCSKIFRENNINKDEHKKTEL